MAEQYPMPKGYGPLDRNPRHEFHEFTPLQAPGREKLKKLFDKYGRRVIGTVAAVATVAYGATQIARQPELTPMRQPSGELANNSEPIKPMENRFYHTGTEHALTTGAIVQMEYQPNQPAIAHTYFNPSLIDKHAYTPDEHGKPKPIDLSGGFTFVDSSGNSIDFSADQVSSSASAAALIHQYYPEDVVGAAKVVGGYKNPESSGVAVRFVVSETSAGVETVDSFETTIE